MSTGEGLYESRRKAKVVNLDGHLAEITFRVAVPDVFDVLSEDRLRRSCNP